MRGKYRPHHILEVVLLSIALAGLPATSLWADEDSPYLDAVREFADNVLKYGRDTYGPKHTPLFVDGLNIHTHEPVKWIAPNGDRWILSNLASQQNLFRTLDGLTKITGDPKYRQAAVEAIEYAFANLRSPNGLLWWGECIAYDAHSDKMCGDHHIHVLKAFFPYYELMWEVGPEATREFIESFWASHILDWSNLDMNRSGPLDSFKVAKGWDHEYKGGPVFFESKGGLPFITTGSDLYYAAAILSKLSGQREPLIWGKRLARRYVETRDPRTGISGIVYSLPKNAPEHPLARDFKGHIVHDGTIFREPGWGDPLLRRYFLHIFTFSPGVVGNMSVTPSICQLMIGEILGDEGKEFQQWALEELSARGKVAYRRKDNSWIPMLADGTSLEGYICKRDIAGFALKGNIIKAWQADPTDFWAYALAFRVTANRFMWEMTRNILLGNGFGDIGSEPQEEPQLNIETDCSNAHALLGFLSLYQKTQKGQFLDIAKRIGDNIQISRFHKGFFVPSEKHIYAKLDAIESLVLLHLYAAMDSDCPKPALVWPSTSYFWSAYRRKGEVFDSTFIYTLTESTEPPISLNEVAITGNTDLARALIDEGADIDNRESGQFKTPLHCAAMSGHIDIVELLLAKGADINARGGWRNETPLHYATMLRAGTDIIELLIAKGANVNAKNNFGDTPLQYAAYNDRKDIIKLLLEKGATISTIHLAAYMGDLAKLEAFIQEGVDINTLDGHGYAPLHYAAQNGQKEAAELLIAKGVDVNVNNWPGQTPLDIAVSRGHKDIIDLLLSKGANINTADNKGNAIIHHAAEAGRKDIVELLIANGADINAKNNQGQTPLDIAVTNNRKDIIELLLAKCADTSIHVAAQIGDLARVGKFVEGGANVNAKNNQGMTALHLAVREKHQDVAKFLITKGADINGKDKWGYTPLYYSIWNENKDIVKLLVTKGADVNLKPEKDYPPLHYAVWMEYIDIVKLLVANGAKFDFKDQDGWTAFRYAASQGSRELVEFFVSKGADVSSFHMAACVGDLARVKNFVEQGTDVDTKDELGWTALYWAASISQEDVAEFLIAKGANVHAKANDGTTILHQAAQAGEAKLVEQLLLKGADVNAKTKNGNTPLHSAASAGNREVVDLLIVKGANVDAKSKYGHTPLYSAALRGRRDVVELLVAKGADIDAKARSDQTALHLAAIMGRKDMAALLIAEGADVNSKDVNGQTPLHLSVRSGRRDTAQLLITKGADMNAKNKWGRTPLDIALDRGHTEIVELLRKHGAKE